MKAQEILETVSKHIFEQGVRSITKVVCGRMEYYVCRYRGDNGTSCAVGCLIPDEHYDPKMEGHTASDIIVNYPELPDFFHENLMLLSSLQIAHDNATNWESTELMKAELRSTGATFGLDTTFLDNLSFKDR